MSAWSEIAQRQGGLVTRRQLTALGVDRWAVAHRVRTGRWIRWTPTVIGTTTGELNRRQLMWLGVLHGGGDAQVGHLSAAEVGGLRNWSREAVTILVPHGRDVGAGFPGIEYVRSRHAIGAWVRTVGELPITRIEPAVLGFAARQRSARTAAGVLAACVQQRLTTPAALADWIDRMTPLRGAARFRAVLDDIGDGAQSVAEIDVRRVCRAFGLARPIRQTRRRDRSGRWRFTDCEWQLADGRVLVLEVDGAFHMDVEHWEDDLARQRGLTAIGRIVIRCSARELRDEPDRIARDLRALGVPAA